MAEGKIFKVSDGVYHADCLTCTVRIFILVPPSDLCLCVPGVPDQPGRGPFLPG